MKMRLFFSLLIASAALAAERNEISQDITVRGKSAGPAFAVPPPAASKPVVDEVLRALALGKGDAPSAETIRVSQDAARLERPFPEPPFLALSPENIRAAYDSWTFEVRSEGEIVYRSEGVSVVRERLDWDGSGADGRFAVVAGGRYRYRFTGRRGARAFTIESEPVTLKSFTRREYVGETRLEAASDEIFEPGKDAFKASARAYLDAVAERLRAADGRPDGTYKLELYQSDPRGALAKSRAKTVARVLSGLLVAAPERVKVTAVPPERGEALAAFVPPSKGPGLRME